MPVAVTDPVAGVTAKPAVLQAAEGWVPGQSAEMPAAGCLGSVTLTRAVARLHRRVPRQAGVLAARPAPAPPSPGEN